MTKLNNWKKKLMAGLCAGVMAVTLCVPATALAADYPGVDDPAAPITGTSATTMVGLKSDDSQISFIAPTQINYAMKADGSFIVPSDAKIQNNSVFDIKVTNYTVTDENGHGVAEADYASATQDNSYAVQVTTSNSGATAVDFAVTNSAPTTADWTIAQKGTDPTALGLTFSNGHMKNVKGSWAAGKDLSKVVWTVASA